MIVQFQDGLQQLTTDVLSAIASSWLDLKSSAMAAVSPLEWKEVKDDDTEEDDPLLSITTNDSFLPFPHFCTTPSYDVSVDGSLNSNKYFQTTNATTTIAVEYQCAGEEYELFGKKLYQFAIDQRQKIAREEEKQDDNAAAQQQSTKKTLTIPPSSNWGHHIFPLPAHAAVLVMGNSHTRQVVKAIECQFAHQIEIVLSRKWDTYVVRFKNGSALIVVANSPLLHSKQWQTLLEEDVLVVPTTTTTENTSTSTNALTNSSFGVAAASFNNNNKKVPINTMDAIVFGTFNFRTRNQEHSGWYKEMTRYSQTFPDLIQFNQIHPPTFYQIAQAFNREGGGHILHLSSFNEMSFTLDSEQDRAQVMNVTEIVAAMLNEEFSNRSCAYLDGRKYVPLLDHECATAGKRARTQAGVCVQNYSQGHRCTGPLGGHSDLLAFDLVDFFHSTIADK